MLINEPSLASHGVCDNSDNDGKTTTTALMAVVVIIVVIAVVVADFMVCFLR